MIRLEGYDVDIGAFVTNIMMSSLMICQHDTILSTAEPLLLVDEVFIRFHNVTR